MFDEGQIEEIMGIAETAITDELVNKTVERSNTIIKDMATKQLNQMVKSNRQGMIILGFLTGAIVSLGIASVVSGLNSRKKNLLEPK